MIMMRHSIVILSVEKIKFRLPLIEEIAPFWSLYVMFRSLQRIVGAKIYQRQ